MGVFRDFVADIAETIDDLLFYNRLYDRAGHSKLVGGVDDIVCNSKYELLVCCNRLSVPLGSVINTSNINRKLKRSSFLFSLVTTPKIDLPEHISRCFSYPQCSYFEVPKVDLSLVIADKGVGAAIKEGDNRMDYKVKFLDNSELVKAYLHKFYNLAKTGKRVY